MAALDSLTKSFYKHKAGTRFAKQNKQFPQCLYQTANLRWYLVITCKKCGLRQPLFRDPSNGKATIRRTYKHRCEKCQHEDYYEPEEIERYQHLSDE
jgi:predicted nucleic-acid-binding Zn-ribbon protein